MEAILIVVGGLIVLVAILVLVVLPKAEQHDREKGIERSMRQEIVDHATQQKVARKLLDEAGQK